MNELSDQNEILVQTVEELEREANDRVALMENKLQRTTLSLKVYAHVFHTGRFEHGATCTCITYVKTSDLFTVLWIWV